VDRTAGDVLRRLIDALAAIFCVAALVIEIVSVRADRDYWQDRAKWDEWRFEETQEIRYAKEGAARDRKLARQTLGNAQTRAFAEDNRTNDSGRSEYELGLLRVRQKESRRERFRGESANGANGRRVSASGR
jgi:hypothetical protein